MEILVGVVRADLGDIGGWDIGFGDDLSSLLFLKMAPTMVSNSSF